MTIVSGVEAQAAAAAIVLGAVGLLVTQVVAAVGTLRNGHKLDTVKSSVDGHTDRLDRRIQQLTSALTKSGTQVPDDPSASS